ncbi:MAG: threonine--tRNA ligase [Leptospiraceae bacterium]|nr:threonine--tRNA ligase [Leptospiraceae bacterium]MCP5503154.1 threonine--tRNA ligase [Leptospiraceae bacterium]
MEICKITLPDGSVREIEKGKPVFEFVKTLGKSLEKAALAAKVDGKEVDLSFPLEADHSLEILTFETPEGREVFHHSSAHLLGQAVQRIFKGALLTIGPVVESGPGFFYYDIDFGETVITPEDLPKIEKEMQKIVNENLPVFRKVLSREEAVEEFKKMGEKYKVELIQSFDADTVSIYGQGEWSDLCRGPHVPNTGKLKAFKLTAISGAYWKGDRDNKMLQRIYGVAFPSKKELDDYIFQLEEAKKRDHRKLGKEMDLFSFQEEAPGFPFWHPKGTILWNGLADYIRRECTLRGYSEIRTPAILDSKLWKKSGHWDNFRENMYFTEIDETEFAVKPMNCPGCTLVYRHNMHSYRDLPLRYAELGTVHRHELSGVLHGLFRVRAFTQDDAHIFVTIDMLQDEIIELIDFTFSVYKKFGFQEFKTYIATRPEKSIGSEEDWSKATEALKEALNIKNIPFEIKEGEGAFYGPKIEFNIKDSIGRMWQCGTIQIDFSMPNRFGLEYASSEGTKKQPVMVHRAIYGSLERFIGILIEHYEGKFPLWLSPEQIRILPVLESHIPRAKELHKELIQLGFRSDIDERNEKIGFKIRDSILRKANYMLILGDKEVESGKVSVRKRGEEKTLTYDWPEFLDLLRNEVNE